MRQTCASPGPCLRLCRFLRRSCGSMDHMFCEPSWASPGRRVCAGQWPGGDGEWGRQDATAGGLGRVPHAAAKRVQYRTSGVPARSSSVAWEVRIFARRLFSYVLFHQAAFIITYELLLAHTRIQQYGKLRPDPKFLFPAGTTVTRSSLRNVMWLPFPRVMANPFFCRYLVI